MTGPFGRPFWHGTCDDLDSADHQGFCERLAAIDARFLTADAALINLDNAAELVPARPDHRSSQLVHVRPGGLIRAQAQQSLATPSLRARTSDSSAAKRT